MYGIYWKSALQENHIREQGMWERGKQARMWHQGKSHLGLLYCGLWKVNPRVLTFESRGMAFVLTSCKL